MKSISSTSPEWKILTQAQRLSLRMLFSGKGAGAADPQAYREYGYRSHEIGDYLEVHAAKVSRRLKQVERANV